MNKAKFYLFLFFLLVGLFGAITPGYSQTANSLTSKDANVDDYTDAQIKSYLQQAQAAGYTDDQIIVLAQNNGMSAVQIQKLQARIADIRKKDGGQNFSSYSNNANRQYSSSGDTSRFGMQPQAMRDTTPQIFGSSLFIGSVNNSFVPNLNIATPVNYIVGPRDQLSINVSGNSVANWNLTVTPEGNINIPNVGDLHVAGKTIEQVLESIKNKLRINHFAIDKGTDVTVSLGGNIRTIQVILQGQFVKPGTYGLPSLTDAYAALFAGGGPNKIGSYRKIEVIRNNAVIAHIDLYDFLTKGTKRGDITLRDMDVVRIPAYDVRIELKGQVKIPGLFEVLPKETLQTMIDDAGGFTDSAYTTRIKTIQISDQQRKIRDVFENQYSSYFPKRGDKFVISKVLNRYENRVTITGAVFKPGEYEVQDGLTISQLIKNAGGLKEDAFTGRASLIRLKPDNTTEQLSINLAEVMTGKAGADILLKREDNLVISSIFDLRDKYKVTIKGEVRNPGEFTYADSMKVADLIIRAGGFSEGASAKRIEVSRRVYDSDPTIKNSKVANVFNVDITGDLKQGEVDFTLKPYDIVSIYSLPGFEKQKTVKIEGEVMYAGYFTIEKKNEKISDIIARAGGLTVAADIDGGSLKRNFVVAQNNSKGKADTAALNREESNRLNRLKQNYKDSTPTDTSQLRNNYVGINLRQILDHPGSFEDLILEDGDILRIPKEQQTVKINGEVLFPSAVVFSENKSFKDYVLNAGGYSPEALKSGAYVVYPNGTVRGTHKILFFNSHPRVKPGSEIFVPKKPADSGVNATEILAFTTGLASLGAIILGILNLTK